MRTNTQLANLIFEAAVVKRMQRTGWQILGDNEESIGEHTFMTCAISYFLAKQLQANRDKVFVMALFHDFHEARTGDVDKIATLYVARDQGKANRDIFKDIDDELLASLEEFEKKKSLEAKIVYEANIIALLVELKILVEKGNINAQEWIDGNIKRLHLPESIELAQRIIHTNSQDWWNHIRQALNETFSR